MHIKSLIIILLCTLIYGCSDPPNPENKPSFKLQKYTSTIVIEEDAELKTLGRQQTVGGICFIKLKKYPTCLQHEVRHCIEGNFHEGRKSDEDCYE